MSTTEQIIQDLADPKPSAEMLSHLAAVIEYSDDAIITKTLERDHLFVESRRAANVRIHRGMRRSASRSRC